jgi:hypothetical protein
LAKVTASAAIAVTPELETVMSPVTATDVGTLPLLPTRMFPLDIEASFECAIAAEALTSAFTITPDAIAATPVLETVMSPVSATDVGTFALLPTRTFPLVKVASLLNAIAALVATEAFVTERAAGVLTPASEIVRVYESDGIVLADWVYWNSFGYVGSHGHGTLKEAFHNGSTPHEDVILISDRWPEYQGVCLCQAELHLTIDSAVEYGGCE